MQEHRPARQSSGLYEGDFMSSNASLAAHAANPAGTHTPTNAGNTGSAPPAQEPVPFYKRRKFIICQIIFIPLGIAMLFILLFPVVTAIAQLVVNRSHLNIEQAQISSPANNSFELTMSGFVSNTGVFPAKIEFTRPIEVSWVKETSSQNAKRAEGETTEVPIGAMNFTESLNAKHKRATINQTTTLRFDDEATFGDFAKAMITQKTFKWRLKSDNLRVKAAQFPTSHGVKFDKTIELQGFNSFRENVRLKAFELPSDNPGGGINFRAVTELNNPSPFKLNLGTVVFDLFYDNLALGRGTGKDTIIGPGTNEVALEGTLIPRNSTEDLAKLSKLFTSFLNAESVPVIAKGVSTLQPDGTAVSWLSSGLTALELTVPFVSPDGVAIAPIKTIDIGSFDLKFQEPTMWSPGIASDSVLASLELPFGFDLSIGEIQNEFNISRDGSPVAGLSTPLGASKSDVKVESSTRTTGVVNITIGNSNLSCPEPQHASFSSFNSLLTNSEEVPFQLIGHSRAIANMSVGIITLDPIKVNVTTKLRGLSGLKGRTTIQAVDVTGGTTGGVQLAINTTIENPSNLNLATGDLSLQLFRNGVLLGNVLLPDLNLKMGNNSLVATSLFAANDSPEGLQTLNDFVAKKDVPLTIAGYDSSTKIAPLLEAFKSLSLDVTLPGLKTNLLNTASLKVLPNTGRDNIAKVSVKMTNPFSTPLKLTRIQSTVSAFDIPLGTIDTTTGFSTAPKADTTSPELDLNMNLAPEAIFTVTRALAVKAGLDVAPLDGIVELGGITYLKTTGPPVRRLQARDNVFTGFDLPKFVHAAFAKLESDVKLKVDVTMGEYATTLEFSQLAVPTATDESLDLLLPFLASPIVKKIVDAAGLGIDSVLITDPALNSFTATLEGSLSNAGPFDASIAFPDGLTVAWAGNPLGNIKMGDVKVVGDVGGKISSNSRFQVADVGRLTDFTRTLITSEGFDWEISGQGLVVSALGIKVPDIDLSTKKVSLKGFNGLKDNVKIKTFDLPSNDPAGGIHLTLEATTFNPSQVGVALSSIGFETYVGNIMIAPVSSKGGVTLAPGKETVLSLVGRLVPQKSSEGLATVSDVFNNFVAGKDSNVIVQGSSTGPAEATWLSEGIKALRVATVLPNRGRLDIIKSIDLKELSLLFTQGTAYAPVSSSKNTLAAFTLPFGFPLDITALEQSITTSYGGKEFAQLIIPKGPAKTDVSSRVIQLAFDNVPFSVFGDSHSTFDDFVAATTMEKTQTIRLSGSASADASTAVGVLGLKGISFSVDSTIAGLQGLNARPVTVSALDVNRGFRDYLLIKLNSGIYNPSNLTIGTDDVSFGLQFSEQTIGTVEMNDLLIKPGNQTYPTDVHFAPQGGAVAAGRKLLENYIQGIDVNSAIVGNRDSTPIASLKSALSRIHISPVTIPALQGTLLESASLSFPINIVQTGIAETKFTLKNPFTASINLLRVGADAKYKGILLGTIPNIDISAHPLRAEGHSSVTSPALPLKFNLDPVSIIRFLSAAAQDRNVNLGPLVPMFRFIIEHPDYHPPVTTTVDTKPPVCSSGKQFDVAGAILQTLSELHVDLSVDSSVKLDDYATELAFDQKGVPAAVDRSALFIIGAVAGPITQSLVDGSVLKFDSAKIIDISNDGFELELEGSLTNIGPLDAQIQFTEPVVVNWKGFDIAEIDLPPICADANTGVPDYKTKAHLRITDREKFTEFAIFLLHNHEFTWTISTSKLRVTALGTIFDNVALKKDVTFRAFNNLPGVSISNFQLPGDDPAGGIHIETDALIPSPAQIGIDLGTVTFEAFYDETPIGPLAAEHLTLEPNSVTKTHLAGRMVPQSGANLAKIGELFSGFLAGKNITLVTKGSSVQPDGSDGPVDWLSEAFKTLELEVTLPGEKFEVIQNIFLNDLEVTIQNEGQAFAPPTSSKATLAKYKNPFGFSLQVVESAQNIILASGPVDIAQLVLEKAPADGGVSTGNVVDLHISWENQILKALNPAAFAGMFAAVTNKEEVELTLKGTADVTARTKIGDVPISGIEFHVESSLKGINAFNHKATLSDVTIAGSGGGGQYISTPLKATLDNPSNISLHTTSSTLPVFYENTFVGRAVLDPFDLAVGSKTYDAEFRYQPTDANDTVAQAFVSRFLTTPDIIPVALKGDADSTPFASLKPAFSQIQIGTELAGFNQANLITSIYVQITLDTLVTDLVSVKFTFHNPLSFPLTIKFVQSDSGVNGETYAFIYHAFEDFTIPAGQTVESPLITDVPLVKGAIPSLEIIPLGYLDLFAAATVQVDGGYTLPWLKLNQERIPTTYDLVLGLAGLRSKAKELKAGRVASSVSSNSASATVSDKESDSDSDTTATATATPTATATEKPAEPETKPTEAETPESTPTESTSSPESKTNLNVTDSA